MARTTLPGPCSVSSSSVEMCLSGSTSSSCRMCIWIWKFGTFPSSWKVALILGFSGRHVCVLMTLCSHSAADNHHHHHRREQLAGVDYRCSCVDVCYFLSTPGTWSWLAKCFSRVLPNPKSHFYTFNVVWCSWLFVCPPFPLLLLFCPRAALVADDVV